MDENRGRTNSVLVAFGSSYVNTICQPLTGGCKDATELFAILKAQRNDILKGLVTNAHYFMSNLWKSAKCGACPLYIDRNCQVQMGYNKPSLSDRIAGRGLSTVDLYFKCKACALLDTIVDLRATPTESFRLRCPSHYNQSYTIKSIVADPHIRKISPQTPEIRNFLKRHALAGSCYPRLKYILTGSIYQCDSFSNALLINIYLQGVLAKTSMPHLRPILGGFICGENGYFLQEGKTVKIKGNKYNCVIVDNMNRKFDHTSYKTIRSVPYDKNSVLNNWSNKLPVENVKHMEPDDYIYPHVLQFNTPYMVWSIFYQITALFNRLEEYDLTFNEMDNNTYIVSPEQCQYVYDGLNIIGDVTFKINNLEQAGITVASNADNCPIRICTKTSTVYNIQNKIRDNLVVQHAPYYVIEGSGFATKIYFRIPVQAEDRKSYLHFNRMGVPLYGSSFDFYRTILLFMMNPTFYHIVVGDKDLRQVWVDMWRKNNYQLIEKRLLEFHATEYGKNPDYNARIMEMLTIVYLQCRIVGEIWSKLKMVYDIFKQKSSSPLRTIATNIVTSP